MDVGLKKLCVEPMYILFSCNITDDWPNRFQVQVLWKTSNADVRILGIKNIIQNNKLLSIIILVIGLMYK